ncbi:hypothetical protein L596_009550 [Steinernema carpocapsae]|uniref:Calmodulin-binding domain-containing protein n=1 Tax=Steinernema carpocapsae TaxID=34508 RepID=A0A4U5PGG6_STECR|nr:hypothetical protein L596_009550 [Steinernema carpocapsae]
MSSSESLRAAKNINGKLMELIESQDQALNNLDNQMSSIEASLGHPGSGTLELLLNMNEKIKTLEERIDKLERGERSAAVFGFQRQQSGGGPNVVHFGSSG